MTMHRIMKHIGLPIRDQFIEAEIDSDRRVVTLRLRDHLDSAMLIDFCRHVLESEGVRVVDDASLATFGPAHIEGRYALEVQVEGHVFEAQVVQMVSTGGEADRHTLVLMPKPGGDQDGLTWFRTHKLAVFDGKTAADLVAEGRAADLIGFLDSLQAGFVG